MEKAAEQDFEKIQKAKDYLWELLPERDKYIILEQATTSVLADRNVIWKSVEIGYCYEAISETSK